MLISAARADDHASRAEALLQSGQVLAAMEQAGAIVAERPDDPRALILLGRTQIAAGRPGAARHTARAAWRAARGTPDLRFDAARLGARAAADERRFDMAQLWLRLAADNASDPYRRLTIAQSMAAVRSKDPTTTRLTFAITPSNNINGGSSEERLIVDGIPTPLLFTGDARALSGIETRLTFDHRRRVARSAKGATFLGVYLARSTFALSSEARAQAPDVAGEDFSNALVELSLRRTQIAPNSALRYGIAAGRSWYGNKPQSWQLRVDATMLRAYSGGGTAEIGAVLERRVADRDGSASITMQANAALAWRLGRGNVRANMTFLQVRAPKRPSEERDGVILNVMFDPKWQGTLVQPTVTLSGSINHYDTVLGNVFGTNGRTDRRLGIDLQLGFAKAERLGFVPTITVSGARTWSNVSRFQGDELEVAFGLSSSF